MTTNINELPLDDTGKPNPEFYAKPAGGYSDGYVVVQRGVGIVCECFDDTGEEAKAIAWFMSNRTDIANLIEAAKAAEKELPELCQAGEMLRAALSRIGGAN